MKETKATTILELLTVIAIVALTTSAIVTIFVSGWRNYGQQSALTETSERTKSALATVTTEIRKASRVLESYNFYVGDLCGQHNVKQKQFFAFIPKTFALRPCQIEAFLTNNSTLVMSMPSLDNNYNIIPNRWDYEVIFLTNSQLKSIKNRWDGSQYLREEKIIMNNTESVNFSYEPAGSNITDTERITVTITTFQPGGGATQKTTLTAVAKLRNK